MSLLITAFEGLAEEDFDNYLPARWSNNRHNLGRMKTKERVMVLARALADAMGADGLTLEASSEIPSVWNGRQVRDQWAYVLRDDAARRTLAPIVAARLDLATRVKDPAEHHRHALMCVRLDHQGLEVGLRINRLAGVDLANLVGRGEAEPEALAAALADIPAEITLDEGPVNAARLLRACRAVQAGEAEWLIVGRAMERDEVLALGEGAVQAIEAVTAALIPLFRFALWTPANDHVGVEGEIEAFAEAVEARQQADDLRKAAAEKARESREAQARARTSAKVAAEEAWRKLQAEKRRRIAAQREAEEARQAEIAAAKAAKAAAKAAAEAAEAGEAPAEPPAALDAEAAPTAAEPPAGAKPERPAPRRGDRPTGGRSGDQKGRGKGPRPARGRGGRPGDGPGGRGKGPAKGRGPAKGPGKAAAPAKGKGKGKGKAGPPRKVASFKAGDRCRLTRGLFAGKEGVIKGPGKSGYYKVKVGPLEVAVSAAEIEPAE